MTNYPEVSRFSHKEEMANAVSHFAGALLAAVGLVLMLVKSLQLNDSWKIVSSAIFGSSMIILYLSSTFTHYLKQGKIKNFFFSLDKIAIYFLIAGTYTPFALITLHGAMGWTILGIEWGSAIIGSLIILFNPVNFEKGVNTLTVVIYATMGWLIIIAFGTIIREMPTTGWVLILLGGAMYSLGIYFYKKCTFNYHHLVWHLLVIAGSLAHFFAIYFFVL